MEEVPPSISQTWNQALHHELPRPWRESSRAQRKEGPHTSPACLTGPEPGRLGEVMPRGELRHWDGSPGHFGRTLAFHLVLPNWPRGHPEGQPWKARAEAGQVLEGVGSKGKGCFVGLWRLWPVPAFGCNCPASSRRLTDLWLGPSVRAPWKKLFWSALSKGSCSRLSLHVIFKKPQQPESPQEDTPSGLLGSLACYKRISVVLFLWILEEICERVLRRSWDEAWAAQLAGTLMKLEMKEEKRWEIIANYFLRIEEGDGEKREHNLLEVGKRAGLTLINISQES